MGLFRREAPDELRERPPAYSTTRAMTAAATRMNLTDKAEAERVKASREASKSWQTEAWEYYDSIGEIKYGYNLVSNVSSRCRLYAAYVADPSQAPIDVSSAVTQGLLSQEDADKVTGVLGRLSSAFAGQPGLIRDATLNLQVAGECYLVQTPSAPVNVRMPGEPIRETWEVRSVDELTVDSGGKFQVQTRSNARQGNPATAPKQLPPNAYVGRIWRSHPRFSDEPDSSMLGILDLCSELLLLNRGFRATARSRLNAGAMYIPDALSSSSDPDAFGNPSDSAAEGGEAPEGSQQDQLEDEFENALIDAMTTPIQDESSAAAIVPLLIRGPAELGDKIKLFKFERSFDPALAQRSDRVLERILQGIDLPKDVVTGLANVRYSNAIAIEQGLYKAHVEPLMLMFVDALSSAFLQPALLSLNISAEVVKRLVVWYDPSEIVTNPDRGDDANEGFDRYAISYDAWRSTHGFTDADAPSPDELVLRLMIDKGAISPDLTESILKAIAPHILAEVRAQSLASSPTGTIPPEVQRALAGPANGSSPPVPPAPPAPAAETPGPAEPTPAGPVNASAENKVVPMRRQAGE